MNNPPKTISSKPQNLRWQDCRTLTCSVLPVRMACNLNCKFCFSKSSVSTLQSEQIYWSDDMLFRYYQAARARGATRLVLTGGGEPLLRPRTVLQALQIGREFFHETALFTNAALLTKDMAMELADAGLSYVCWSRHHHDDTSNRDLMGKDAPSLHEVVSNIDGKLAIRATCVMCQGFVASRDDALQYRRVLGARGIRQFTFKHTYTAYDDSVFGASEQNQWALANQSQDDPFAQEGEVIARLPWGPEIKHIEDHQVCYYHEPTPQWELTHQLARSWNLLSDGSVYASLENKQSLLFRLRP